MSVTRINEFQARDGHEDDLRTLIGEFLPGIRSANGCISCRLLQNLDDPTRLVVIEVWESVTAHQESLKALPPETMEKAMELLASPPRGGYYEG